MAGIGPDDVHLVALDLLDAATGSLNEIPTLLPGEGLSGAPDRSFVSPPDPVWDCCEMLVVHHDGHGMQNRLPEGQAHRLGSWLWEVRLVVTIGRCVPTGTITGKGTARRYNPPAASALQAAARQISADGWALANGIAARLAAGALHEHCSSWKWDGVNPATPMGGCAGWTINFRAQIDGYQADPGT